MIFTKQDILDNGERKASKSMGYDTYSMTFELSARLAHYKNCERFNGDEWERLADQIHHEMYGEIIYELKKLVALSSPSSQAYEALIALIHKLEQ